MSFNVTRDSTSATEPPDALRRVRSALSVRTGIVTNLQQVHSELLPRNVVSWSAKAAQIQRVGVRCTPKWLSGSGVGLSHERAQIGAVGEAVERYGAVMRGRSLPIEFGSYRDFEGAAIHGEMVTLPSPAEVQAPFVAFDEKSPRGWVGGRDLTNGSEVLVPAQLVLPFYEPRFDGEELANANSNGIAAHVSIEAATLSALREIEERDAFLVRYFNRWSPEELDLSDAHPDIESILESIPPWLGLKVRAWDLTLDLGQPVRLVALLSDNERLPPLSLGAACRGSSAAALREALLEAFQVLVSIEQLGYPEVASPRVLAASAAPEDHIALSCQPGYLAKLEWLLGTSPYRPASDTELGAETLDGALDAVADGGLNVIAIDLTPPDLADAGFAVCRVLVPGTQPLMFGSMQCRSARRLRELPVEMKFRDEPLDAAQMNQVPHPFP